MKQKLTEAIENCKKPDSNLKNMNALEEALIESEQFNFPTIDIEEGYDVVEELRHRIKEVCSQFTYTFFR